MITLRNGNDMEKLQNSSLYFSIVYKSFFANINVMIVNIFGLWTLYSVGITLSIHLSQKVIMLLVLPYKFAVQRRIDYNL